MNRPVKSDVSTVTASLIGLGVGLGAVALYLVGGLVVARWSVAEFAANLTLETVGALLLLGALTVLTFAVPIVAYVRFHVFAPVAVLVAALLAWFGYAVATGIVASDAVFGLGLYAIGLSPLYFVCYAIAGGTEYYVRNRTPS